MSDNGELPLVGMECTYDTTFFTIEKSNAGDCRVIAYFEGKVWLDMYSTDFVINLNVISFKPLTPPIELIDGNWYLCKKTWGSKETRVLHRNQGLWFYDLGQYPDQAEGDYEVISKLVKEES